MRKQGDSAEAAPLRAAVAADRVAMGRRGTGDNLGRSDSQFLYPRQLKGVTSGPLALIAPHGGAARRIAVGYGMLSGRFQPTQSGRGRRRNDQWLHKLKQQNPPTEPSAGAGCLR